jgi:hypothetical protein
MFLMWHLIFTRRASGWTHDELDGHFGDGRKYLVTQSWRDVPGFERALREAFKKYRLPVIINWINDVLAFDKWLEPAMDSRLRNFSTQHNDINPGMHSARFVRGDTRGSVKSYFRLFKQDTFARVCITAAEYNYWTGNNLSPGTFFPRVVDVKSEWEEHSVLLRGTVGDPAVAPRIPGWEDSLDKCLRECHQELSPDLPSFASLRKWWTDFIGIRASALPGSVASGQFVIAAAHAIFYLPTIPRIPWDHRAIATAAEVVAAGRDVAPHLRTMGSAMAAPERAIPPPRVAIQEAQVQVQGNGGGGGRGRGVGGGRDGRGRDGRGRGGGRA